ncbi:hypothetical protein [Marinobacter sp.]|uniref:hypothetical protein n=1 Tax=Marinobacter sp. TaxID=50741 RepID=UPI003A8DA391
MPISDSSPERRNLVVVSVAFILFYLAEGSVSGNSLRLFFVNIEFNEPVVLAYGAWVFLFWFGLRFWQKNGFNGWKSVFLEVSSLSIPLSIKDVAAEKILATDPKIKKLSVNQRYYYERLKLYIVCNIENESGSIVGQNMVSLGEAKNIFYPAYLVFFQVLRGNAFSEELVPYLLFIGAVTAPFWSYFL